MGLAAGQARLLTITGRKSDCEFESMRLSHQKIALARQLADLSNEYQNSITQTKLIYDYYGTGDASNPLTYGILMKPSALNNYMPTIITDSMGRVALSSSLAAAAFKAGIPQEGLGTLPGEKMRQKFIQGLYESGEISQKLNETIQSLPYNQQAGFGGGTTVVAEYQDITYSELLKKFKDISVSSQMSIFASGKQYAWNSTPLKNSNNQDYWVGDRGKLYLQKQKVGDYRYRDHVWSSEGLTLYDLLSGTSDGYNYTYFWNGEDGAHQATAIHNALADYDTLWAPIIDLIIEYLDNGTKMAENAINYAVTNFQQKILLPSDTPGETNAGWYQFNKSKTGYEKVQNGVNYDISTKNGICIGKNSGGDYNSYAGIDITNALQQFITYYVDFINGVSKEDAYGMQVYNVGGANTWKNANKLVNEDTVFTIKIGSDVSSDDLGQATFYDALFNQICMNGWTENNQVTDKDYLQQMLQNGMLYISKMKDDGYYYQGNYATDNYIKEIPDESKIAQAEAKYATEKAKLNAKEETIDLKMKNLDTEISALTTEYDTVKNTISKQIEKCFKRYNA